MIFIFKHLFVLLCKPSPRLLSIIIKCAINCEGVRWHRHEFYMPRPEGCNYARFTPRISRGRAKAPRKEMEIRRWIKRTRRNLRALDEITSSQMMRGWVIGRIVGPNRFAITARVLCSRFGGFWFRAAYRPICTVSNDLWPEHKAF